MKKISLLLLFTGLIILIQSCSRSHLSFVRTKPAEPSKIEAGLSDKKEDAITIEPESLSDHSETAQIKSSPQTKPAKSAISKKLLKPRPQKVGIPARRPIPEPKNETHEYEPNSILAFISFIVGVIGLSLIIIGIPAISLAYLIFALGLTLAIYYFWDNIIYENQKTPGVKRPCSCCDICGFEFHLFSTYDCTLPVYNC